MISSLQIQFPNAEIIGCLFHFKQAVGRKLHRIGIPVPEKKIAMTKGVLDILTVIDHDLIDKSGIPWVQSKIKYLCREARIRYSKERWTAFWTYFRRTWLHWYPPPLWNVHGLENALVATTNNPLERFNRTMNDAFAAPHPSLTSFVTTINELSIDSVKRYQDTVNERSMGRLKAKKRLPPRIDLPDEPGLFSIRVDDTDELSDDADGMVGHDDSADGDTGQESSDYCDFDDDSNSDDVIISRSKAMSLDDVDLSFDYTESEADSQRSYSMSIDMQYAVDD